MHFSGSIDECSSKSTSVEDLNLRNLRNSQENLCKTPSSQNILSLSDEETLHPRAQTKPYESDNEKDVADISVKKKAEDEEIESMHSASSHLKQEELPVTEEGDCYRSDFAVDCYKELRVNLQVTENYKEYSQVSPKGLEEKNNDRQSVVSNPSAKPKVCVQHKHSTRQSLEDNVQEKKLLEFYNKQRLSSKFEAEKKANEKIKKKRSGRNNRGSHNADLDEMYRLPTEHLCMDRDYSNERIKQRNLVKMQRQCLARYRDEINEINERLKEASLDGAVGGVDISEEHQHDLQHQHNHQHGIVVHEPGFRVLESDYLNNQRILEERQRRSENDTGLSSPEDHPSSPRASFSSGARPKKSPRKQKAL